MPEDRRERGEERDLRRLPPQVLATLFQPRIQRRQIREVRHLLPKLWPGILDILLDLPLLLARGGIAELGRKDVVVRHRLEANIDLPFLAAANSIDRGPRRRGQGAGGRGQEQISCCEENRPE